MWWPSGVIWRNPSTGEYHIKAKQRFKWLRDAAKKFAVKVDSATDQELAIDGNALPKEIQDEIFVYGISKIVDDRLSQVPADLKMDTAQKLVDQFMAGEWKAERTVGARILPAIIEAIVQVKGCSPAAAQLAHRRLDDEQKIVLAGNLAKQVAAIKEARSKAAEVGLDDLLS